MGVKLERCESCEREATLELVGLFHLCPTCADGEMVEIERAEEAALEMAKRQVAEAIADGWQIIETFVDEDGIEWVLELPDSFQANWHIKVEREKV